MQLLITPSFAKATKKLIQRQKTEFDAVVRTIENHPEIGEQKTGDLAGVRVYKFRFSNQLRVQ